MYQNVSRYSNLCCVQMPVGYNKEHRAQQGPECHFGSSTGLITITTMSVLVFFCFWQGISVGWFTLLMCHLLQALNYWVPLQLSFHSQQPFIHSTSSGRYFPFRSTSRWKRSGSICLNFILIRQKSRSYSRLPQFLAFVCPSLSHLSQPSHQLMNL